MALYVGQTAVDVIPMPGEEGKQLFTEQIRREANRALASGILTPDLQQRLGRMCQDGSWQARHFLGRFEENDLSVSPNEAPQGLNEVSDGQVQAVGHEALGFVGTDRHSANCELGE